MALVFEQFLTESIGDASYLVGDDSARVAAVIDPQVDIQRYVTAARKHGVALTHVVQTHIHEDFVSGATALANACGNAEVWVSGHDAPHYQFAHRSVKDGEVLELGSVVLTVKHTPGHTPEHISLLIAKKDTRDAPFAVLSGGSLLVGAAGRTDLLGLERAEELTRAQFRSLRDFFLALEDGVQLWPTHVHGSPCGAAIGDKTSTTIGYERKGNPLLQQTDEESFRKDALDDLPANPRYYPRLKERNTANQPTAAPSTAVRPLSPAAFNEAMKAGNAVVLDTRHLLAFGGAHVPGAWNIGGAGHLGIWSGWMLDPNQPMLLVLDSDSTLSEVVTHLAEPASSNSRATSPAACPAGRTLGFPCRRCPSCTSPWPQRRASEAH